MNIKAFKNFNSKIARNKKTIHTRRRRKSLIKGITNCAKYNFKIKLKQILASVLSLFLLAPFEFPSAAIYGSKQPTGSVFSSKKPNIYSRIQNKLTSAIKKITITAKTYPGQLDTIGVTGADIINFRNQLTSFIKNHTSVTDSFTVFDMVKNNEKLYRFLIDKRNGINLTQKRSLEDLSEADLCCLQKLSTILIEYFKMQIPECISPELTEDTPELRTIAATLYCFITEQEIKNPSLFFDDIVLKVNANRRTKPFTKCIKDIIRSQTTPKQSKNSENKQNILKPKSKKYYTRIAVICDDNFETQNILSRIISTAKNYGIAIKYYPEDKNKVCTITGARKKGESIEDYFIEIYGFSKKNWLETTETNLNQKNLLGKRYYSSIFFIFDTDNYHCEKTCKESPALKEFSEKLNTATPQSKILYVPITNDSDIDDFIVQNIHNFIIGGNNKKNDFTQK